MPNTQNLLSNKVYITFELKQDNRMGDKLFFLRYLTLSNLQSALNAATDRFRVQPYKIATIFGLGLIAHYFGFMWALTHFEPFYSDWLFFINLSLGFIFAVGLAALLVQLAISLLAMLNMLLSAIWPDRMMKANRIVHFSIPLIRVQLISYTLVASVFIITLLAIYTDMKWWHIALVMLFVPIALAIWGLIVYWNIKNHEIESLDFDLGEKFELSADTIGTAIDSIQNTQRQLESYIVEHLPENLRPYVEQLIAQAHHLAKQIAEYIPEKEAVHEDISNFQFQIAELRWSIAYTKYALPKIRSILIGVFLAVCILVGYAHEGQFVKNKQVEVTFKSGETRTLTPITQRGNWQIYFDDGKIISENSSEILSQQPRPALD